MLGADLYMKRVVVVDHDVDVFDDRQMTWAIATRCQPDRDITIVSHARGSDLDPSTREDGYTAKWGVDATAKPSLADYTPRHRVPPDVLARLDLKRLIDFLSRPNSRRLGPREHLFSGRLAATASAPRRQRPRLVWRRAARSRYARAVPRRRRARSPTASRAAGVGAGRSRRAVASPNGRTFVAALLGALELGATVAPLDPLLTARRARRDPRPPAAARSCVHEVKAGRGRAADRAPAVDRRARARSSTRPGSTGRPKGARAVARRADLRDPLLGRAR